MLVDLNAVSQRNDFSRQVRFGRGIRGKSAVPGRPWRRLDIRLLYQSVDRISSDLATASTKVQLAQARAARKMTPSNTNGGRYALEDTQVR